jgi:hypothetical protein
MPREPVDVDRRLLMRRVTLEFTLEELRLVHAAVSEMYRAGCRYVAHNPRAPELAHDQAILDVIERVRDRVAAAEPPMEPRQAKRPAAVRN